MRYAILLAVILAGCSKSSLDENDTIRDGNWRKTKNGDLVIIPGYQKDGIHGFDVEVVINGDVALECRVDDPAKVGDWCSYKDEKTGRVIGLRWTKGDRVSNVLNPSGGGKP